MATGGASSAALADRYRIECELGSGGMATVYFAQDSQTGHGVYGHSLQWLPARDTGALRIALIAIGAIFVVGVFLLMRLWPDGFAWEPRQSEYEQMILGIYVVLGIFLLLAARNPLEHLSLIWFTAWSSLVHGLIMLVQALVDPVERANLLGDVPALIGVDPARWTPHLYGGGSPRWEERESRIHRSLDNRLLN